MAIDESRLARLIVNAHRSGTTLTASTDHGLDVPAAYRVQTRVAAARWPTARVGWKLGYTSPAMRQQMGVDEPNYGPLHAGMVLADDAVIGRDVVQPRVEPEIAAVVRTAVWTPGDLISTTVDWYAALEVVDSVWDGYRFDWALNTADGSSAAFVVLGGRLDVGDDDLAALPVRLEIDGRTVATGSGSAAMGGPRLALRWLVDQLAARAAAPDADVVPAPLLDAGSVVITGGLTAASPLMVGSFVRADLGPASVRLRRD